LNQSSAVSSANAPVEDDMPIYRLVPTGYCDFVDGEWQFQSAAFDNNEDDDMSVTLGDTLLEIGRRPEDQPAVLFPNDPPGRWGVAVLRAGFLKNDENQTIRRTPTLPDPAHGDVHGKKGSSRRKRIKRNADWVVQPTAAPPSE
jgi:hypothetical protein